MTKEQGAAVSFDEAANNLTDRLASVVATIQGEHGGRTDPIHLELELAARQNELYEELLSVVEAEGDQPFVRVLGAHCFTYDRHRLTTVMTRTRWNPAVVREVCGNGQTPSVRQPCFFNQLVMLAYRQIFEERRTLNAWLLRTSERQVPVGKSRVGIHIQTGPGSLPEDFVRWVTVVPPELADDIMPTRFVKAVSQLVYRVWQKHLTPIGASERFRAASELHEGVREEQLEKLLPNLDRFAENADYQGARERVCLVLGLPITTRSGHLREQIERDVFVMLQSAIFYMKLYDARAFYSLTTKDEGVPYGLTALTATPLSPDNLALLESAVDRLGKFHIEEVRETLRNSDHRHPGHVDQKDFSKVLRAGTRFLSTKLGCSTGAEIMRNKQIPAFALATFLKVLEEAAEFQIEHQYPKSAFVLGQASYLESVGFVEVEAPGPEEVRLTYPDLVAISGDGPNLAHTYELDRWEKGRGILPNNIVARIDPEQLPADGVKVDEDVGAYLSRHWGYPEPSDGFHLLDLDPRFIYPEFGIRCVRRLEVEAIGWFREGSPPGSRLGYKAYLELSKELNRFVAGITDGAGNAFLISDGRVIAAYRQKDWEFYDHAEALATVTKASGIADSPDNEAKRVIERILIAAEHLSHSHRKGGIFVLTDLGFEEWEDGNHKDARKFLIPMVQQVRPKASERRTIEDTDHLLSFAQVDGACIIGKGGEILGYGYKIAASPSQVRSKKKLAKLGETLPQPGSRRWSSALLSLASGWDVVNISSDGPVTLFVNGSRHSVYPTRLEEEEERSAAS